MILVLEVEYLSGVSFAALGRDSDAPEWPPQPDRVFSALVAAWAARGQDEGEARALEWLEQQRPPRVDASAAEPRTAPIVFVPPNDPRSDREATARQVLPAWRKRQPRRFPAARPHDAIVQLLWADVDVEERILTQLQRLAGDVVYVGHSSSLTRCRFMLRQDGMNERHGSEPPRRHAYPGRLTELRREFEAGRRPPPGAPIRSAPETRAERSNIFGERWLLLEHVDGDMPDVRACALVAKTIRDAILSGYQKIGLGGAIPDVVSGHTPDRKPSPEPHIAIVPLCFAGFPYADGHVMGFAVVPPHASVILDDQDFRRALRAVAPIDERRGRRILNVRPRGGTPAEQTFSIEFSPAFEPPPNRRSLDPGLYTQAGRDFATVTPITLDRHLKTKGEGRDQEIGEQIARACRNIGLPEPEAVVADKHSTFEGVPSAYPSGNAPAWLRWRLPPSLATRQLTHAFIRFPVDVLGPVILGAGRYFGLGLCRAISP